MPSGSAIRAGRAFVEMFLDDSKVTQGLKRVQQRMKAFGSQVSSVGKGLFGAGAAFAAPLLAAAKSFAKTGDELNKMSARTGVAVESLSELQFAAEQSGSDLETVEKGLKGMARTLYNAERGLTTANEALGDVGVSLKELQGLSPEDQFTMIADRLSAIEDPTRRSAIAMKLFGQAGSDLLPMFANGADGITKLRGELRELGQFTTADGEAAAEFTDELNRLWTQMKFVTKAVGGAVAVALTPWLRTAKEVAAVVSGWAQNNRGLFATILKVAGGVAAFGAALTALGTTIQVASFGLGGLAVAVSAYNKVVAAATARTLAFRLGAAGLAAGGIAVLALAIYKANPALREFNRQLERSDQLASKMKGIGQRRQENFLKDVAVLGSPEEKRAAVNQEVVQSRQNIAGVESQLQRAQREVERLRSGLTGFGRRATGNKLLAAAEKDVEQTRKRLEDAQEWAQRLQDTLKDIGREEKLAETLSQQPGVAPGAEQPAAVPIPSELADAQREMKEAFESLKRPKSAGSGSLLNLIPGGQLAASLFGDGSPIPGLLAQLQGGAGTVTEMAATPQGSLGDFRVGTQAGRDLIREALMGDGGNDPAQKQVTLLDDIKRQLENAPVVTKGGPT